MRASEKILFLMFPPKKNRECFHSSANVRICYYTDTVFFRVQLGRSAVTDYLKILTVTSVSYTHLDVYKRQMVIFHFENDFKYKS